MSVDVGGLKLQDSPLGGNLSKRGNRCFAIASSGEPVAWLSEAVLVVL